MKKYTVFIMLLTACSIQAQTNKKDVPFNFDLPAGLASRLQGYRFTDSQHVLIKNGSDNLIMLDLARFSLIDHPRPEQALLIDKFNIANLNEQTVDDISDPSKKYITRLVNKRNLVISGGNSNFDYCSIAFTYDISSTAFNEAGTAIVINARGNYSRSKTIMMLSISAIALRFSSLQINNEFIKATRKDGSTINFSFDNSSSNDNIEIINGITIWKEVEEPIANGGQADFFRNIDKSWLPSEYPFVFSKDGKFLALPDERLHSAKIYNILESLQREVTEIKFEGKLTAFTFSNSGEQLFVSSTQNSCELWDLKRNRNVYLEKLSLTGSYEMQRIEFTPDNSYMVAVVQNMLGNRQIVVWDTRSGKVISSIHGIDSYKSIALHPVLPLLLFSLTKKTISLYDIKHNTTTHVFNDSSNTYRFSMDGAYIITSAYRSHTTKFWDAVNYQPLFSIPGRRYAISPDNKVLLWDNKDFIYFFDIRSKKIIYKFGVPDSKNYVAINPEGYYFCSKDIIPKGTILQKFDLKYNRPDKVILSATGVYGNQTDVLIKSYLNAYEKRVKLLGMRMENIVGSGITPEIAILNKDSINTLQNNEVLKIHLKASDKTKKLLLLNVRVNEVPVYGMRGLRILSKKSSFDTTIYLTLSQGNNIIEVVATNENGIESNRASLQIKYTPAQPNIPKVFFAGIGINQFNDSNYNLSWSVKDIRDLVMRLKERYKKNLIVIDTLFDKNFTVTNIKALKNKLSSSTVNDKVVVAYSGHGLLSKENEYFLSTYDINFSNPADKGLPFYELENILDSIPARQKLMFVDACHSGEVDKDELSYINKVQKEAGLTSKGVSIIPTAQPAKYGMQNSFELMRYLFADLRRNTGTTIIAAAGGMQFALERANLRNGVFTYSILEYLQLLWRSKRTVSDLRDYVTDRVAELTRGAQVPTSRSETTGYDWELW